MKIIENYCRQPFPYSDAEGWLKIELEDGDNREEIIKEYEHKAEHWADGSCLFCENQSNDKLLVFRRHRPFLD